MGEGELMAVAAIITAIIGGIAAIMRLYFNYRLGKKEQEEGAAPVVTPEEAAKAGVISEAHRLGIAITPEQWSLMFSQAQKNYLEDIEKLDQRISTLEREREEDRSWIRNVIPWAAANNYRIPFSLPAWYLSARIIETKEAP